MKAGWIGTQNSTTPQTPTDKFTPTNDGGMRRRNSFQVVRHGVADDFNGKIGVSLDGSNHGIEGKPKCVAWKRRRRK